MPPAKHSTANFNVARSPQFTSFSRVNALSLYYALIIHYPTVSSTATPMLDKSHDIIKLHVSTHTHTHIFVCLAVSHGVMSNRRRCAARDTVGTPTLCKPLCAPFRWPSAAARRRNGCRRAVDGFRAICLQQMGERGKMTQMNTVRNCRDRMLVISYVQMICKLDEWCAVSHNVFRTVDCSFHQQNATLTGVEYDMSGDK